MSELKKLIEQLSTDFTLEKLGYKGTRFSISLDYIVNRRAEYIARSLNMSKQELITKLFTAALDDLEVSVGLAEYKDTSNGAKERQYKKQYLDKLVAEEPIENYFK